MIAYFIWIFKTFWFIARLKDDYNVYRACLCGYVCIILYNLVATVKLHHLMYDVFVRLDLILELS